MPKLASPSFKMSLLTEILPERSWKTLSSTARRLTNKPSIDHGLVIPRNYFDELALHLHYCCYLYIIFARAACTNRVAYPRAHPPNSQEGADSGAAVVAGCGP